MKLLAGLAVAASLLSSAVAAASKDAAPVHLLRKQVVAAGSATEPPQLPRQLVRKILLQRIRVDEDGGSLLDDLPQGYDAETTVDMISQYGLTAPPLFAEQREQQPAQMVLLFDGITAKQVAQLKEALPAAYHQPSFVVADPPSQTAHERLRSELAQAAVPVQRNSAQATVDFEPGQWADGVYVGFYDVSRDFDLAVVAKDLARMVPLVESGEIDITLVLLPESSRSSKLKYWTTTAPRSKLVSSEELRMLRARKAQSESVMLEEDSSSSSSSSSSNKKNDAVPSSHEWVATAPIAIPACFQSFNSCVTQTGNCSNHGGCVDKYAHNSGRAAKTAQKSGAASCFVCHCYSTLNRPDDGKTGLSTTQWAGNMCQKKDVSAPFWLLTGFTVTLIGIVTFSIGMLFNVGEEKLPGVIGAGVSGVSRAK